MSLFKAKEFWSNRCSTDEDFDQNSLTVCKLNTNFDYVLIGSHSGVLRIYKPSDGVSSENVGFNPNDLLIEKILTSAILQTSVGKLVSGSSQSQIAVLHPRSVIVFNLVTKEGIAEHGTQNILSVLYDHKLRRSAANFVVGPFGGAQNRDFICVQSLDGMLTFFEQESFNFCCFLPDFLLPGPLAYVRSNDSFVTAGSNWYIQNYRYKTLSEAGQNLGQDEMTGKKISSDWSYNLGENVLDIQSSYDDNSRQNYTAILGERNFYCFSDSGRVKFMKRLEFAPSCFYLYYLADGRIMTLLISETNTLLVYQETTLKWSAQLQYLPIAISRAFFKDVSGALVMLSEDGYLEFSYLGTEPNLFSAPPLKNQELDFEKADQELTTLNKIIKSTLSNDLKFANSTAERELVVSITVNPHLEEFIDEFVASSNSGKCCCVEIDIVPQAIFEEVHVSVCVQTPLCVTPQTQLYTNLNDSTKFKCRIYLQDEMNVPSVDLEVVVSFLSSLGVPRVSYKKTVLPLKLVMETCQPLKEGEFKITLNTNQDPVPLSTLFPEYMGENSLSLSSTAIGIKNIGTDGPIVSLLVAKSSQRYRLQSNSLCSLNMLVQEIVRRLKLHFSGNPDFMVSFNSSLPISEAIDYIRHHFDDVQIVNKLQSDLAQLSAQLRLIQKRLISKFKQKNPTPLSNLDILLRDTNKEIFDVATELDAAEENLAKSQINLSCVLHLLINLLQLTDSRYDSLLVQEALSPNIYDLETQNWEDVIDASLYFLLRTTYAKSEKDQLRAPHTSFDEVKELSKLEKHFSQVLERSLRKGPLLETNFDDENESEQIIDNDKRENAEELSNIGTEIGCSSSRALSARKSLLKRRHKADN